MFHKIIFFLKKKLSFKEIYSVILKYLRQYLIYQSD